MELRKQVCSLELAKKLNELGVEQESLFWWWFGDYIGSEGGTWEVAEEQPTDPLYTFTYDDRLSAFTGDELANMCPEVNIKNNGDIWQVKYKNKENITYIIEKETKANAIASMLVLLLKNNEIKLKEKETYSENNPLETLKWINERKKLIAFEYKETTKSLYFKVDKNDDFMLISHDCEIIFDGKNFIIER